MEGKSFFEDGAGNIHERKKRLLFDPFDSDEETQQDPHCHFKFIFMIFCAGLIPVWIVCMLNSTLESTHIKELPIQPWDTIPSAAPTIEQQIDLVFAIFASPEEETFWPILVKYYQESVNKYCPPDLTVVGKVFVCDPEATEVQIRQYPFRESKVDLVLLPCIPEAVGLLEKSKRARQYLYDRHTFTYLLKVDADIIVNFQLFFKAFEEVRKHKDHLYAGAFRKDQQIFTDTELKKVQAYYPKYATSNFYMLSSDLVKWLVEINKYNIRRTKTEDTFVGLILSSLDGIKYIPMSAGKDIGRVNKEGKLNPCDSHIYCWQDGFMTFEQRIEIWNKTLNLPAIGLTQ